MDSKWWTELTLLDVQQSRAVLATFTDENAERPEDFDQVVRAFCIKVLLEGQDAARRFVSELENINRAKLELIHVSPSAPEHERWLLKIGGMVIALDKAIPLLPERYRATIREMHAALDHEYQMFCGERIVLLLRAKYLRLNGGDVPPKD